MLQQKSDTPTIRRTKHLALDSPCLNIPPSPFMKHLGFGTGVNVYLIERSPKHGEYRSPWAVKKINQKCGNQSEYVKRLKEEATILKDLSHKNIVGFRSFTHAIDGTCCLVMEDGQKSLLSFIEDRTEKGYGPFPVNLINEVIVCLSSALSYLHHDKHLLHGDLKSGNVLVQGDFNLVKLCDFGVSLRLDDELVAVEGEQYVGTQPWSCKEVLEGRQVSNKADIFAFGMTLYELLTLAIPHMHYFPEEEDYKDHAQFEADFEMAEDEYQRNIGTRPPLVDYEYDITYASTIELFWTCTNEEPRHRPSAIQIVDNLDYLTSNGSPFMPNPKGKLDF